MSCINLRSCSIPHQHTLVHRTLKWTLSLSSFWLAGWGSASTLPVRRYLRIRKTTYCSHFPHVATLWTTGLGKRCVHVFHEEVVTFLFILIVCCSPHTYTLFLKSNLVVFCFLFLSHHSLSNYLVFHFFDLSYFLHPFFSAVIGNVACVIVSCYLYIFGLVLCCYHYYLRLFPPHRAPQGRSP